MRSPARVVHHFGQLPRGKPPKNGYRGDRRSGVRPISRAARWLNYTTLAPGNHGRRAAVTCSGDFQKPVTSDQRQTSVTSSRNAAAGAQGYRGPAGTTGSTVMIPYPVCRDEQHEAGRTRSSRPSRSPDGLCGDGGPEGRVPFCFCTQSARRAILWRNIMPQSA